MLGAIIGDIVGSVYEFDNTHDPDFPLFSRKSIFTDDTVLSLAVAEHLLSGRDLVDLFHHMVERYPDRGWGGNFHNWALSRQRAPYNSYGNGAAMRVSATAWLAEDEDHALELADEVTRVTHNHPEGIKGAKATALAIWMTRQGEGRGAIRRQVRERFGYDLDTPLEVRRKSFFFDESCQGTVPPAIRAVLEAENFEQAIRNAITLGGDSDTLAAIAGSIAEPLFGVPDAMRHEALDRLDDYLRGLFEDFEQAVERQQ